MGALFAAFLAETALITYRDIGGSAAQKQGHTINGLPLPADYLAAVLVFGVLGLAPKGSGPAKVAALVGWGFVLATAVGPSGPWNPSKTSTSTKASTAAPAATLA